MIGAVIFVIFFLLFFAVTFEMPTLPPGGMIHELFAIPEVETPIFGIPTWLLINSIVNGVAYGFIIWLLYTIVSYATRSGKKEEKQPYAAPPPTGQQQAAQPTAPPPQTSAPPATPMPTPTPQPTQAPTQPAPEYEGPAEPASREEFTVSSENLADRVKELLHEENVTGIVVKDEKGKVLLDMPATAEAEGTIATPWLAALEAIAALATECTISVARKE